MRVRPFLAQDTEATYAIFVASVREGAARFYSAAERQAWAPNDTAPSEWRDRLSDHVALVAEEEGMLVGFTSMTRGGHLDFLYVAPAWMGLGVAGHLYTELMASPELAHLDRFEVQASHFSRRFLLKRGWTDAPPETVERFGHALTVFRMTKQRRVFAGQGQ